VNIDDCDVAHMDGASKCQHLFAVCQDASPPALGYSCQCADASRFDGTTCANIDSCVTQVGNAACESLAAPYDGTCSDIPAPGLGFTCSPNGPGTDCTSGTCFEIDACIVGGGQALCTSAGNLMAACEDVLAPGVRHTCNCTRGFEETAGICMDYNSCTTGGGLALCQSDGETAATCGDVNAPGTGHLCDCGQAS
jgi:hypothetical protein